MNNFRACLGIIFPVLFIVLLTGCSSEDRHPDGSSDTDGDTDSDTDGDSDSDADADSDTDSDADTDSDTDVDSDTDSDSDTDTDTDSDTDSDSDTETDKPLIDRLDVAKIPVPEGVKEGVRNWRIWGTSSLHVAPVFVVPLNDGHTLVGYTTDSGSTLTPRVSHLDAEDALVDTLELDAGYECRGLAAESNDTFAALLWDNSNDQIFVKQFDLSGTAGWTTELVNSDNNPTDFGIGESRLEFGNSTYGAYYHVHSDSGHEGDTLKWVDASSGAESTGWSWGCSHSMSNLLRFNAALSEFLPVCVTDCYPGTSGDFTTSSQGGIYLNHRDGKVMDVDAGCNGDVAGEIGSAALAPNGWKLVFNAHQNPMTPGQNSYNPSTMNQDIGFSSVDSDLNASDVVWLTDTADINEADATIARWEPAGDHREQYVLGWVEPASSRTYKLARVDASGNVIEGPVDITLIAQWGRRDDPMRQHENRDIVWAWFEDPGSTTLHFARLNSN
ncbi:MAG: hypothetical protein QNJ97_08905 [Myxococcota bacterium]|nr:hypothetical protein [Myxococcota bacterium]